MASQAPGAPKKEKKTKRKTIQVPGIYNEGEKKLITKFIAPVNETINKGIIKGKKSLLSLFGGKKKTKRRRKTKGKTRRKRKVVRKSRKLKKKNYV